jgi:hypothetical protein
MPIQYKIVSVPSYITDVESYLNTLGSVASGSYQLLHLYNGQAFLISGSQGTTINVTGSVTAGTVSSSAQVKTLLPAGTVSSSTQFKTLTDPFTGSFTGSFTGAVNTTTGGYNLNGHSLFNYGQFYDTTIQSGSADTAYAMKLNTTDIANGVSVVSSSRITVANTGIYNLQFSSQLYNTANTNIEFDIWFAVTGSPVPTSNTKVEIDKQPGTFGRNVAAWNIVLPLTASQYAEIYWSCNAATGQLYYTGSATTPTRPAIPSVIATMTQVA